MVLVRRLKIDRNYWYIRALS